MDSRLKLALCHLPRKLGPGLMAAGARQFIAAMFGHNRLDLRQLKSLVARRLPGSCPGQEERHTSARGRIMIVDMVHLFDRKQLPFVPFVALLATRRAGRLALFGSDHSRPIR